MDPSIVASQDSSHRLWASFTLLWKVNFIGIKTMMEASSYEVVPKRRTQGIDD